jgi:hypothetical protein
MTYQRGKILKSYAQVEFLLADISVKLELKFPYLVSARIKAIKRIAEREGYEVYKADLETLCGELLVYDELRNYMAHGFVTLVTDKAENHLLEMLMYQRQGEGKFQLFKATTTLPRLIQASADITRSVQSAVTLFERIYRDKGLEPQ